MFELKPLWNFMLCYVNFKRWVSEAFLMTKEIEYELWNKNIMNYRAEIITKFTAITYIEHVLLEIKIISCNIATPNLMVEWFFKWYNII